MTLDRIGLQNASLDVDCRFSNAYSNVFWDLVRIRTRMYVHRLTAQCVFCFLFHLVALYLNALLSLFCAHPTKPTQLECDHTCFQSGMEIRPRATCIVAFCAGPICGRWEDERLTNNGSVLSCFSSVPTYVGVW